MMAMSYEKELEYLRKEFNKSSAKFHQAEAEGYETDAEMWEDDMVNIGHQIHIHEKAAKADEYEAKAEAFEEVAGIAYWYFERVNPEYADFSDYEGFYDDIKDVFKRLESGESDE